MTNTPPGSAPLPELVVRRLAVVAVTALLTGAALLALAVFQPGKVDATTVAVIGNFVTLAGTAVGGLGAILASTRTASDPPSPVTVMNPPATPVLTSDVPPAGPTPAAKRNRSPIKKSSAAKKRARGQRGSMPAQVLLGVLIAVAVAIVAVEVLTEIF
jgi:hypothetical protein